MYQGGKKMIAKDIMTKDVFTVDIDSNVDEVAHLLINHKISGVPVVDKGKLVGIISEGDLVFQQKELRAPAFITLFDGILQVGRQQFYDEIKKFSAYKVEDLMTKDVITVKAEAELNQIATIMINKNINRLPVVDNDNKILGIISRHDIIKHMYT